MSVRRVLLLPVLLGACLRPIPPALGLPDVEPQAASTDRAPTDRAGAVAASIGRDPLARSPRLLPPDVLDALPDAQALARVARELPAAEAGEGSVSRLQEIEDLARGTEATAILRGTRLGIAERMLVERADQPVAALADLAPLLTRLRADPLAATRERHPFEALAPGASLDATTRAMGARWVLAGWLDGPDVPLEPVARTLAASPFDGLRESPLGRVLVARAEGRSGDPGPGLADLTRATALALQQAAADRHAEQGAWADVRERTRQELGADDPIAFLLERAHGRLVDAAGTSVGAGAALLAATAARLADRCGDPPCRTLDRVETLLAAGRWDPLLAPLARAWSVIALKRALDTLEVGHDTVMFRPALVDLVDALLGTGASPPPAGLLTRTAEEAAVWQLVGASLGDRSVSTWDAVRVVLGAHLAAEVRAAIPGADPSWRPSLDRILLRAVP